MNRSDPDLQLPNINNCSYYSIDTFQNNNEIHQTRQYFSALHSNIWSLSANFENLYSLLADLSYKFSIIGLSEIKFMKDCDITQNLSLNDYSFVSQPSLSCAGGVGMYIDANINYIKRNDLSKCTK